MDIAKCDGNNCNIRDNCYRYTAQSHGMQVYIPAQIKAGDCAYFIERNIGKAVYEKF